MTRIITVFVAAALGLAAIPAALAADDLFTMRAVKVDATGESATQARDLAIAQGRPAAWRALFRRLTREREWPRQPPVGDAELLRMIRGFQVANEKRSTTRYLAEITYVFRADDVRNLLQRWGISYSETRSKPVVVLPLAAPEAGLPAGFDPLSAWSATWTEPRFTDGLVPFTVPLGDVIDLPYLGRPDVAALGWAELEPLVSRYGAGEILFAEAVAEPGRMVLRLRRLGPRAQMTKDVEVAFPEEAKVGDVYLAAAEAAAHEIEEAWKATAVVDFTVRDRLSAEILVNSLAEWTDIQSRLDRVPLIVGRRIVGLTVRGGELDIEFVGQLPQLQNALAQVDLELRDVDGYWRIGPSKREGAPPAGLP